jgi:hypothetical protein
MYLLSTLLLIYYSISICLILSLGKQAYSIYTESMNQYNVRRTLVFDIISILIILTILPVLTLDSFIKDFIRKGD